METTPSKNGAELTNGNVVSKSGDVLFSIIDCRGIVTLLFCDGTEIRLDNLLDILQEFCSQNSLLLSM